MRAAGLFLSAIAPVPPVPAVGVTYKTTLTNTVDETETTWLGVDIGVPHPRRLVILASHTSGGHPGAIRVNGIPAALSRGATGSQFAIFSAQVSGSATATIVFSATGSVRKAVSVYVAYPNDPIPLDTGLTLATSITDAVVANIKTVPGGFIVWSGGQNGVVGGPYTVTWTGADAPIKDIDSSYEATTGFTMGHINSTVGSDEDDLTLAETVVGTKLLVVSSWGRPPP